MVVFSHVQKTSGLADGGDLFYEIIDTWNNLPSGSCFCDSAESSSCFSPVNFVDDGMFLTKIKIFINDMDTIIQAIK